MPLDTAKAVTSLRGLTAHFDNAFRSVTPFYQRVCNVLPSVGADEQYSMLGTVPLVREWIGDRKFDELRGATYTLVNKHWESSLLIKKTDIADARLNQYAMSMQNLAGRAARHPDKLLFQILTAGESTVGWDGQYFFDTDHSWGDSGSQSNDLTYDASSHTAVTAAEFKAAFHAARLKMVKYVDDRGEPLNQPTFDGYQDLMVLVPPELQLVANEAFRSQLVLDAAASPTAAVTNIVLDGDSVRIVMSPFLTDATKFYLFNLGEPLKPFIFQAREPLSRQMKGLEDSETKDVKFMTEARYNVGYLAWWTAVLTTFN